MIRKEKKRKEIKIIHKIIDFECIDHFFKETKHHFEILDPIPKDAQLIHLDYDSFRKILHLFFISEKGHFLKEGHVLSSIPSSDIVIKKLEG